MVKSAAIRIKRKKLGDATTPYVKCPRCGRKTRSLIECKKCGEWTKEEMKNVQKERLSLIPNLKEVI